MSDEEIIKYIDGEMGGDEASVFEQKMSEDAELATRYRAAKAASKVSSGFVGVEIDQLLKRLENGEEVGTNSNKPNKKYLWALLLLTLIATVYYFSSDRENESEVVEKTQYVSLYVDPVWPLQRGGSDDMSEAISKMFEGKVDSSLLLLSKIDTSDLVKDYWSAEVIVHEKTDNDKVLSILDNLIAKNYEVQRCQYLRIVHLVNMGRKDEAMKYIKKMDLSKFSPNLRDAIMEVK